MSGALLALDLGTSGVRALRVDPERGVEERAHRALSVRFPEPGRAEQDPEELYARSVEVLRAVAPRGEAVALGVTSQRATCVAWDAATGEPLCPAVSWQDQRTAPRVAELRARGIPVTTLPSATKFEWWLAHEPAVGAAARAGRLRLGTPDVWLTHRLSGGGAFVTDPSCASATGLFDLAAGDWSAPALALFGLDREWLPRVVDTAASEAETPRALLGRPVPLAARIGDQQAAAWAQGARRTGAAKLTLGTAAMLDVHAGAAPPPFADGAYPMALWRLAGRDEFCREASVLTAGAAVDWLVALGLLDDARELDRVAGSVDSAEGAIFVPALQGLGTPHLDPRARGLLLGLTRGTRAAHVVRAALEGIAHRCADLCEALALAPGLELPVDGGLARSALLLQRLADLAQRPLLRAAETETTGVGAAVLAGVGAGVLSAGAPAPAGPVTRFEPRARADRSSVERARWRRAIERSRSGAMR